MSRWLAIFDREGRVNAGEGSDAFRCYPHFRESGLVEVHRSPDAWLGIWGPSSFSVQPSISVLFDGALYAQSQPGFEAMWLAERHRKATLDLSGLNGRWSFLIYDQAAQQLLLARDRVGVKPLYYWKDEHRSVFASEPKLILGLPFVENNFDPEAVFDYFVLSRVDSQRETLFKGIRQILPAHELRVDLQEGTWEEQPYYEPSFNPGVGRFDPAEADRWQEKVREKLNQAVSRRLQYHASPPATFLSGGLDSSALAGLIRSATDDPLTALTASYREEEFAEQQWAKVVVEEVNALWLQTFPNIGGLKADLEDFIYNQDTPTFSAGTYSQYCLFRMARENGVQYIFDGQGADALFGGHQPHLPPLWSDLLRSGQWSAFARERKTFGSWRKTLAYGGTHWLKYKFIPAMPVLLQDKFKRWYFPELEYLNPDILAHNLKRYEVSGKSTPTGLNATLHDGYFKGPLSFLLKCVDRASAWTGVDTCTPYSDDAELMDLVFSIPGTFKIHKGVHKRLLRESCRDVLPRAIYDRRDKMGLVTPNNAWMAQLRPLLRMYLEEQDDALFDKKKMLRDCDQFFAPESGLENFRVYKYLSMAIWRSIFKL